MKQNDKLLFSYIQKIATEEKQHDHPYLMDNINVNNGLITFHGHYPDNSFSRDIYIQTIDKGGQTEYKVTTPQCPYHYVMNNLYQAVDAQVLILNPDFCNNHSGSNNNVQQHKHTVISDNVPQPSKTSPSQLSTSTAKSKAQSILETEKQINNTLANAHSIMAQNQVKKLKQNLKSLNNNLKDLARDSGIEINSQSSSVPAQKIVNLSKYEGPKINKKHQLTKATAKIDNHDSGSTTKTNVPLSNQTKEQVAKEYNIHDANDVINLKGNGFNELNQMIGLKNVKNQMVDYIDDAKVSKRLNELGQPSEIKSLNLMFMGNPGTGKTVVARLVGKIMFQNHIIKKPLFKECSAKDLIGQYEGMTAPKTDRVIHDALGGVLFIDEAYRLTPSHGGSTEGDSYRRDAISELLRQSENHRNNLVIILAGYKDKMEDLLKYGNPGLKSRFNHKIIFKDYNNRDMYDIFMHMMRKNHCSMSKSNQVMVQSKLGNFITYAKKHHDNSNGRLMRNLLEAVLESRNRRIGASVDHMTVKQIDTLQQSDVISGFLKARTNEQG